MDRVDIVIVNWNSGTQLSNCIESVRKFHCGLVGKCVVVDNGSTDGSADFLAGATGFELIRSGENLGFAAACNLGAAEGQSPFVLLLNPDACLLEGSLVRPVEFLQAPENAQVGIVGIQLIGSKGELQRTCARPPSAWRLMAKSFGITALFRTADFHMKEWDHSETRVVGQVMGAFFLMRRHLFHKLGGLDERFFVYFEEVDFSVRAAQLGFDSVYLTGAQAFHKGGGVSEQVKSHRLFYSLRSRMLYSFKHFSYPAAVCVAGTTLLVEPISRLGLLIMRARWSEIADLYRGYRMLWGWAAARILHERANG